MMDLNTDLAQHHKKQVPAEPRKYSNYIWQAFYIVLVSIKLYLLKQQC